MSPRQLVNLELPHPSPEQFPLVLGGGLTTRCSARAPGAGSRAWGGHVARAAERVCWPPEDDT